LKSKYGEYVNEHIKTSIKKAYYNSYSKYDFYALLLNGIIVSGMFSTKNEIAFAMYYIIIDIRIPFFVLDKGYSMDNDVYARCARKNKEKLSKLKFILSIDFAQKTEEASLILKELENGSDFEEQVVLLSVILNTIRKQFKHRIDELRRLVDDISE